MVKQFVFIGILLITLVIFWYTLKKLSSLFKLTKATLTMGWCIECHGAKEVTIGDGKNAYYDEIHSRLKKNKALYRKYLTNDGKLTVNELGGWECAKCHY